MLTKQMKLLSAVLAALFLGTVAMASDPSEPGINPGKPISFVMGEGQPSEVSFHAINPGGKFRTLVLTVPKTGEYTIQAEQVLQTGAYKRMINGKWSAFGERARRFVFDTIPQEAGSCEFRLSTFTDTPAAEVIVELKEYPYRVPRVETGEKLGALRVKNVPYGLATVRTSVFGKDGKNGLEINTIEHRGKNVGVTFSLQGGAARSILPEKESITIKEGGVKAEVLSIRRTRIPLDIVLLVDASGSMKGQMKKALDATREFIQTLPPDARVPKKHGIRSMTPKSIWADLKAGLKTG